VYRSLVIIPFEKEFDPVYAVIKKAAEAAVPGTAIDCHSLKETKAAGRITQDIVDGIQKSAFCIADVTGNNPNVMWETGFAMALGKPTILIGQDVKSLPFDLLDYRVQEYQLDRLDELAALLGRAIRETVARYGIRPSAVPKSPMPLTDRVVVVSGTTDADPARLARRVPQVLTPLLSDRVVWYCGSFGRTDEQLIDFLMAHGQRVIAIGYNALDFSPKVYKLVSEAKLAFIDSSTESVPFQLTRQGERRVSARDVLFVTRGDLAVLFWDGRSAGTADLIRFFQENRKDMLVGYV
jgi:hypothetical protein